MEQTTEKKPTTRKVVEQSTPDQEVTQPTPSGTITHKGFPADSNVQKYVQYAYEKGGLPLVTLMECENALRNPYRKAEGKEDSWGFCMINRRWHKDIVDNQLFRNDWKWQIDQCNRLMIGGTKFYGRDRKINGVKCSEYVLSRFVIGGQ